MAKPDKPLLSLGARGTIADTLTFQKRGKGSATIARRKPIPENPRSQAQLAQRQKYRDAVDAWHALTPEEKQAWRGVCPGLTAYQCFIRSELRKVVTPPEEYTEEQTQHNFSWGLYSTAETRAGQKLTISNRQVTKLGFWLLKVNSPTGDVTLTMRKVSDDSLIYSKVWGDAADLTTDPVYEEVEFDTPETINEEVRILAEFSGGDANNQVKVRMQATDVKADEQFCVYETPDWTDYAAYDSAYRYTYYLP